MGPAKYFNNIIIGQFVLTGVPVKVYIGGRYLTITDADDVEDPTFGFGMDEDGDMQRFDYRNVMQLSVSGNVVDLETYNKGMEAKFGGGGDDKAEEPKDDKKKDDEKADDKKAEDEENPFKDHYMPSIGDLIAEISQEEVDAEIEAAESEIDAAKAKEKAAKAAVKDTLKKAKEKIKAAKAQPIDEYHSMRSRYIKPLDYTFGVGDIVKNKNKSCPHAGSMGVVKKLMDLPNDMGTVVMYTVTNKGATYRPGDVLTKTMDQLEPIQKPDPLEDMDELNVRDVHGDKKIENPKTGKKIKFSSALKAPKGTKVYSKARKMYNRLKEK